MGGRWGQVGEGWGACLCVCAVCVCMLSLSPCVWCVYHVIECVCGAWSGGSGQWEALVSLGVAECATLNDKGPASGVCHVLALLPVHPSLSTIIAWMPCNPSHLLALLSGL
jgi:hypothetical protein